MRFEDLDLEAAVEARNVGRNTEDILKAAIPPVTNWDGLEKLRVNHRVLVGNLGECEVIRLRKNESGILVALLIDSNYDTYCYFAEDLKPIRTVKKIDHSSLVGSCIDCIYDDGKGGFIYPYNENIKRLKSIRMNKWMVFEGDLIELNKLMPEGYEYTSTMQFEITKFMFKVTGIKKGYEL